VSVRCPLHFLFQAYQANISDFAKRHPKIIEDERAVNVVLRMEETYSATPGRRMTITNVGTQVAGLVSTPDGSTRRATITTLGPRLSHEVLSPLRESPERGQDTYKFDPAHNGRQRADSVGDSLQDPSPFTESAPAPQAPGASPGTARPPALAPIPFRTLTSTSLATTDPRPGLERARSSREARERRSSSLRRRSDVDTGSLGSGSEGVRNSRPDFESAGYEELMERLAVIDSRLEARNSRIVDVVVEEGRRWGESGEEEDRT